MVTKNSGEDLELLQSIVLPWIQEQHWPHSYCFQRDGAPSHTTNVVQKWCEDNLEDILPKSLWPPSSPDGDLIIYLRKLYFKNSGELYNKEFLFLNFVKISNDKVFQDAQVQLCIGDEAIIHSN